jgi:hypothetical protein
LRVFRENICGRTLILTDLPSCGSSQGAVLFCSRDLSRLLGILDNQIFDMAICPCPTPVVEPNLTPNIQSLLFLSLLQISAVHSLCTRRVAISGRMSFHVSSEVSPTLCGGIRFPNNQKTFANVRRGRASSTKPRHPVFSTTKLSDEVLGPDSV